MISAHIGLPEQFYLYSEILCEYFCPTWLVRLRIAQRGQRKKILARYEAEVSNVLLCSSGNRLIGEF